MEDKPFLQSIPESVTIILLWSEIQKKRILQEEQNSWKEDKREYDRGNRKDKQCSQQFYLGSSGHAVYLRRGAVLKYQDKLPADSEVPLRD